MAYNSGSKYVIFMGNLKEDVSCCTLRGEIKNALSQLALDVPTNDITITHDQGAATHATINMFNEVNYKTALTLSPTAQGLSELAHFGKQLVISQNLQRPKGGMREFSHDPSDNQPPVKVRQDQATQYSIDHRPTLEIRPTDPVKIQTLPVQEINMAMSCDDNGEPTWHRPVRTNEQFYIKGEILRTENSHIVYKTGTGHALTTNALDRVVATYTSAFLNTDGGTVVIGVKENHTVEGVECDQKIENIARMRINDTLKQIYPLVFPNMYEVLFVPVKIEDGSIPNNLKVVEVCVTKGNGKRLYGTSYYGAFTRKNGKLQGPLDFQQMQAWINEKPGSHSSQEMLNMEMKRLQTDHDEILMRVKEIRGVQEMKAGCAAPGTSDAAPNHLGFCDVIQDVKVKQQEAMQRNDQKLTEIKTLHEGTQQSVSEQTSTMVGLRAGEQEALKKNQEFAEEFRAMLEKLNSDTRELHQQTRNLQELTIWVLGHQNKDTHAKIDCLHRDVRGLQDVQNNVVRKDQDTAVKVNMIQNDVCQQHDQTCQQIWRASNQLSTQSTNMQLSTERIHHDVREVKYDQLVGSGHITKTMEEVWQLQAETRRLQQEIRDRVRSHEQTSRSIPGTTCPTYTRGPPYC